nr:MAG TPA: hypothetical protein [Caudoviricetes sp.]
MWSVLAWRFLSWALASVQKSVSQPLIRSVRFMQVEPPHRCARVIK